MSPDDNALIPGPQAVPGQAGAPGNSLGLDPQRGARHAKLVLSLSDQHDQFRAIYGKMAEVMAHGDAIRTELQKLTKLGPMVTHDDVVEAFGRLAGRGMDPAGLATILAGMPTQEGGEQLAGWVQSRADFAAQQEAQFIPQLQNVRHELGVSALRLLAGHHFADQTLAQTSPEGTA